MTKIEKQIQEMTISFPGKFLSLLVPQRRKSIVKDNIDKVFGKNLSEENKKKLSLAFYSHLMKSIKEYLFYYWLPKNKILDKFEIIGEEHLINASKHGKGVFILTGHLGNFEASLMIVKANLKKSCLPIYCIRREIKNNKINAFLLKGSKRFGLNIISARGASHVINTLINKNSAIIFVLDQHISHNRKSGMLIIFFNHKAGTYSSLANFVYDKQVPVLPGAMYRNKNGKHIIEFLPEINHVECSNEQEFIYKNTLLYNQALEKMILNNPEQWYCWLHNRWKNK